MAKVAYNGAVFFGSPAKPAETTTTITVTPIIDGSSTLYNNAAGTGPTKDNPFTLEEVGNFIFWADEGVYDITATRGDVSHTWYGVPLIDYTNLSGGIQSVVEGSGISIDDTDPLNPIVSAVSTDRSTVTALTSSSGIVTLDYSLGDYFTLTPSENITGWTITNLPGTGKGVTIAIRITQTSPARTVALPTGSTLKGGNANAMPTGNGTVALLFLTTFNNGTTWEATWGVDYS